MIVTHRNRRRGVIVAVALAATLISAATLAAHDFWLVPNGLDFAAGRSLEVLGQSGTKFPASDGPTQPAQVAEARIVGRSSDEKIADLSVSGKSLMLRTKPAAAGQYVVAVALASRTARTTPARLQRYIALEGAPELAARYEQEGKYPKTDSVTQMSAKFAKTIVQVGTNGPRAFDKLVGHALELVPMRDPAVVHVGDSISVRLLFHGKPVAGAHLRAGWGSPSAVAGDAASARVDQVLVTGADGAARVAIAEPGLWNVRTLYAAAMQGMPEHWEVYFATMVFSVGATKANGDDDGDLSVAETAASDSADVVATVARFHAALASGDSTAALALLTDDVAILESGGVESKAGYRAGHLKADIEYAQGLPGMHTVTGVHVRGDAAWVTSSSVTQGQYRERQVNSVGAELMVLTREGGAWKIRAVHWSSRARRTP